MNPDQVSGGCDCCGKGGCDNLEEAIKSEPKVGPQVVPPKLEIYFTFDSINVKVGCKTWHFVDIDEFLYWLGKFIYNPKQTAMEYVSGVIFPTPELIRMTESFFDNQLGVGITEAPISPPPPPPTATALDITSHRSVQPVWGPSFATLVERPNELR
jgi:hypothetical protein